MKIEQIVCQILRSHSVTNKTASCQDSVLVRVKTDTGLEGIGEQLVSTGPRQVRAVPGSVRRA